MAAISARCACPWSATDIPGFAAEFTFLVTSSMLFEYVQFKVGAFGFVGPSFGIEAGLHVVLAAPGDVLDALSAHVMIGERKAIGRDERARAAIIEPDGG